MVEPPAREQALVGQLILPTGREPRLGQSELLVYLAQPNRLDPLDLRVAQRPHRQERGHQVGLRCPGGTRGQTGTQAPFEQLLVWGTVLRSERCESGRQQRNCQEQGPCHLAVLSMKPVARHATSSPNYSNIGL